MAQRILSISYNEALLRTRAGLLTRLGFEVVSAEGFTAATESCQTAELPFDLIILGHSIPPRDKAKLIEHFRTSCSTPVLALLRPHEPPVVGATRSIDSGDPPAFVQAVVEMLREKAANQQ